MKKCQRRFFHWEMLVITCYANSNQLKEIMPAIQTKWYLCGLFSRLGSRSTIL